MRSVYYALAFRLLVSLVSNDFILLPVALKLPKINIAKKGMLLY